MNYWIILCNKKKYNLKQELQADKVNSWEVKKYGRDIIVGDKVILWETGKDPACYALATVTGPPEALARKGTGKTPYKVPISIEYNLATNPVLKRDLNNPWKWGQGTVHKTDQAHYDEMQSLAMNKKQHTLSGKVSYHLNTIFYGPPGTGKTFTTMRRAVEIIEGRIVAESEIKELYSRNRDDGYIEVITFHQNYSYEDFIQGLRPDVDNADTLTFSVKDGVFKKIADRARRNEEAVKAGKDRLLKYEDAFAAYMKTVIDDGDAIKVPMKRENKYFTIVNIKSKVIQYKNATDEERVYTLSRETLESFYYEDEYSKTITGQRCYYVPLAQAIREMNAVETSTKDKKRNYVIIIDEINRANIARVFGELITMIEEDKRTGGEYHMKVHLPSGEPFSVPSNLYIIGTMNTADKSIALLDIALRRRFVFEPMYPRMDIPEIHDVDILRKINEQIVELKSHDFQLGHAYFMGPNYNRSERMNNRVIPLLLEYFMNDGKTVRDILTNAGLNVKQNVWPLQVSE